MSKRSENLGKNLKTFSVVVSEAQYESILYNAHVMSRQEKKTIGVVEMTRRALAQCYPVPKDDQLKLF